MKKEIIIIGAGIIGLAIGRKLSEQGKEVLMLEANQEICQEGSFRNSAVIHAGIYYPPNSLKAKFCPKGKELLYAYCKKNQIAHKQIGKLIVATNEDQLEKLEELYRNGQANQIPQLKLLSAAEVRSMEPQIQCIAAIYSPTTGIVNGKDLTLAFKHDVERQKGKFYFQTKFNKATHLHQEFQLQLTTPEGMREIQCQYLINAAGLGAIDAAHNIQELAKNFIPKQYLAKGNYFKYLKPSPFSKLIYPIPESAGLGIHGTIDLQGQLKFGPDVEWVDTIDYKVNEQRRDIFTREIAKYFPEIESQDLQAEFCGIRPKILPPEKQPQDFLIQDESSHGVKGLINLFGIESPGLTCSMAIAEYVTTLLK